MKQYTQDARERNYSARTLDEMAYFISADPDRIIRQIWHSNSLAKYHRHTEFLDEFKQELSLYLFGRVLSTKFSGCSSSLVKWFNGSSAHTFSRWLVTYTRNQAKSNTSGFAKINQEQYVSLDGEESTEEPTSQDEEYEFEGPVRAIRMSDPDVLEWLLSTKDFAIFSKEHRAIYISYLRWLQQQQRKAPIYLFAEQHNIPVRPTQIIISRITSALRIKIKSIDSK